MVVIGAGLTGLVTARSLIDRGLRVTLLDEGADPGGRLATRRVDGAVLDHGAQFFTVRSDEFSGLVDGWRRAGAPISVWSHGFAQASDIRAGPSGVTDVSGDSHPRYTVDGGMRTLAGVLAAGLDVRTRRRVQAIWRTDAGWRVAVDGDGPDPVPPRGTGRGTLDASALLCTPPVPRTVELFARGATVLPDHTLTVLRAVTYDPCLALLAVVDRDPNLPAPGGVQFARGPVRWLADNARKLVSPVHAVTVHASTPWSRTAYDTDDAGIAGPLLAWLAPWLGDAQVTAWHVTRWRHSQPRDAVAQRAVHADVGGAPVVFAGDAFGHPRVEGAARSGLAAAAALLSVVD